MAQGLLGNSVEGMNVNRWNTYLAVVLGLMLGLSGSESAQATTSGSPYEVLTVVDINPANNIVETYIVADEATVNIASPNSAVVEAHAMAFKSCASLDATCAAKVGTIPGPEFRLKVGDQVIVHFVNNLNPTKVDPKDTEANVSGIHWHGIELNNQSDGTEVTQGAVAPGGTFDYKFTVTRPGIFWYHPHHHSSTNQVAKGLYGSIIVEDNQGYEAALIAQNVIPSEDQTKTLVLSDITVCGNPGTNPPTFDGNLPHVSGIQAWEINYQNHPLTQSPLILCEQQPMDENGNLLNQPVTAGDVPNIQSPVLIGRMSEGFTVLTNGVNVGGRLGPPYKPGDLLSNAVTTPVNAGQGLRLQIVNPSPVRYMRLRLTNSKGNQSPLVRIGGEGGLLNNAVVEGNNGAGGFNFKYEKGEILLPPGFTTEVYVTGHGFDASGDRGVQGIPAIGTAARPHR